MTRKITKLSRWMTRERMTAKRLAKILNVTPQSVNAWRRGAYAPDIYSCDKIILLSEYTLCLRDFFVEAYDTDRKTH